MLLKARQRRPPVHGPRRASDHRYPVPACHPRGVGRFQHRSLGEKWADSPAVRRRPRSRSGSRPPAGRSGQGQGDRPTSERRSPVGPDPPSATGRRRAPPTALPAGGGQGSPRSRSVAGMALARKSSAHCSMAVAGAPSTRRAAARRTQSAWPNVDTDELRRSLDQAVESVGDHRLGRPGRPAIGRRSSAQSRRSKPPAAALCSHDSLGRGAQAAGEPGRGRPDRHRGRHHAGAGGQHRLLAGGAGLDRRSRNADDVAETIGRTRPTQPQAGAGQLMSKRGLVDAHWPPGDGCRPIGCRGTTRSHQHPEHQVGHDQVGVEVGIAAPAETVAESDGDQTGHRDAPAVGAPPGPRRPSFEVSQGVPHRGVVGFDDERAVACPVIHRFELLAGSRVGLGRRVRPSVSAASSDTDFGAPKMRSKPARWQVDLRRSSRWPSGSQPDKGGDQGRPVDRSGEPQRRAAGARPHPREPGRPGSSRPVRCRWSARRALLTTSTASKYMKQTSNGKSFRSSSGSSHGRGRGRRRRRDSRSMASWVTRQIQHRYGRRPVPVVCSHCGLAHPALETFPASNVLGVAALSG